MTQSAKTIGRRELLGRGASVAALVAAIPALSFATASHGLSHQKLVRAFTRQLLTEKSRITAGEWLERKRIVLVLQALIGDEFEPWTEGEIELMAEMKRDRTGTAWS
jgi:hypothetical protein